MLGQNSHTRSPLWAPLRNQTECLTAMSKQVILQLPRPTNQQDHRGVPNLARLQEKTDFFGGRRSNPGLRTQTGRSKDCQLLPGHLTYRVGIKRCQQGDGQPLKPQVLLGCLGNPTCPGTCWVHCSVHPQRQPVSYWSLMIPWGKDEDRSREYTHTSEETIDTHHRWLVLPCPLPALEFRSLEGRCRILSAVHLGQASTWHTVGACGVSITQLWSVARNTGREVTQERCGTMSADKCQ